MVEIDLTHFRDNNNITKLFARILKENRAFIPYIRNLMQNKNSLNALLKNFLSYGFNGNFIQEWNYERIKCENLDFLSEVLSHSFIWDKTPEGGSFWRRMHLKMKDYNELPHAIDYKSFKKFFKYV